MTTETRRPAEAGAPTEIAAPPVRSGAERAGTTIGAGATGPGAPAAMRGRTSIAAAVVEKIAGMAAREVPGVLAPAGGLARIGALRHRLAGDREGVSRGVRVEVGERQTAIDLNVVVEYGLSIPEVTAAVRENVILALERMTGLEVVEVNIVVEDVRLPEEDAVEPESAVRVV
ncbi:Asp23/Gls24 family envelope stress response protein [Streptomyces calidiresistens]|uniref:Asp23/Gls24 family envelope stress response protein n=1 Tax=Streptomyces calidiresistens TaxID=1485586 RepID=A0A7W3XY38_9ACTN|nr:Asp23/Gls24 family envelope stress response protein [Streptomyces calidiresistens]MBB0231411.1 Asp23/Gls24 family envelope stress response protein [Streptomyces calidiresistens]